jgi:hypothetical protein
LKNIFKSLFKGIKQNEGQAKTAAATPNINCKECGMQFESEDNLRIHIKKAHSSKEKDPSTNK